MSIDNAPTHFEVSAYGSGGAMGQQDGEISVKTSAGEQTFAPTQPQTVNYDPSRITAAAEAGAQHVQASIETATAGVDLQMARARVEGVEGASSNVRNGALKVIELAQAYSSHKAGKHTERATRKEAQASDRWSALQGRETQTAQQQAAAEAARKVQQVTAEVYGQSANAKEKGPGWKEALKAKYEAITLSIEKSKAKRAEREAKKSQELASFYGGVSKTLGSLLNNWGIAQQGTLWNAASVSEQAATAYQTNVESQQSTQQNLNAV